MLLTLPLPTPYPTLAQSPSAAGKPGGQGVRPGVDPRQAHMHTCRNLQQRGIQRITRGMSDVTVLME